MPERTTDTGDQSSLLNRRVLWLRWAGWFVGAMLLAAAIWVVATQGPMLNNVWTSLRAAPFWMIIALVLLPLVNWALTSVVFWLLTRQHGRVGLGEMAALIGSAWLLNMLPMKPGLVARVAYHRAISSISIVQSTVVLLQALVTGALAIVLCVGTVLVVDADLRAIISQQSRPVPILMIVTGAVLLAVLGARVLQRRVRTTQGIRNTEYLPRLHVAVVVVAVRILETGVWALRYGLCFAVIGVDVSWGVCVVIAGVSQLAGQSPVQFGVREWVVGISAAVLGAKAAPTAGGAAIGVAGAATGLTVDLINRAAEVVCALPVGLFSYLWVLRKLRRITESTSIRAK